MECGGICRWIGLCQGEIHGKGRMLVLSGVHYSTSSSRVAVLTGNADEGHSGRSWQRNLTGSRPTVRHKWLSMATYLGRLLRIPASVALRWSLVIVVVARHCDMCR
jgi:hypothetical protein